MSIILFIGRKSTRTVDPLRKGHSYHLMLSVFSLLLISCAAERDPGSLFGPAEQGTLVVDATLIVDRPMPPIFIRQTIAPNVVYTQNAAAVNTAEVIITQGASEYKYLPDPVCSLGRYLPPVAPPFILPETEYRILVRFGGKEARAVTTTPKRFTIDQALMIDVKTLEPVRDLITFRDNPNTVFTAPVNQVPYLENLIETRFQPINVKAYQVGIINLETDSDFVISGDFLDDEDFETLNVKAAPRRWKWPMGTCGYPGLPLPLPVDISSRYLPWMTTGSISLAAVPKPRMSASVTWQATISNVLFFTSMAGSASLDRPLWTRLVLLSCPKNEAIDTG